MRIFRMNNYHPSQKRKNIQKKPRYGSHGLKTLISVFDDILGSIREPLLVMDSDLKVVKATSPFT